jgi:DNA-binding transcriptional LysR family regulator
MELRHLRYFAAVAEHRQFRRAAAALHISTPTLSQQIRALEREVGADLLVRAPQGVELTAAGSALLPRARQALRQADSGLREARVAGGVETPIVRVGLLAGLPQWLPAKVERVLRAAGADVRMVGGATSEQVESLARGELDVALVRGPLEPPTGTQVLDVAEEELGVLLAAEHPLAPRSLLEPADLDGRRLIWFPRELAPGFHDAVVGVLEERGVRVTVDETTMTWGQRTSGLPFAGDAYSIATARAADGELLVWRPLAGRPLTVTLGVAWRTGTGNRPVRELVASFRRGPGLSPNRGRPGTARSSAPSA